MTYEKMPKFDKEEVFCQVLHLPRAVYMHACGARFDDNRPSRDRPTSRDIYLQLLQDGLSRFEKNVIDLPANKVSFFTTPVWHNKGLTVSIQVPKEIQARAISAMGKFREVHGDVIPYMLDFYTSLMEYEINEGVKELPPHLYKQYKKRI
jgi:hypothetical protein